MADNRHASGGWPAGDRVVAALPTRRRSGEPASMNLDLDTIETTFDLLAPRGDELMDVFYARLFAAASGVGPLFTATDLRRQKAMLLSAPVLAREFLHDTDA